MKTTNQTECIDANFNKGLGIFDHQCWYQVIDDPEDHSYPTAKVKDIQGIQAHAGYNFFFPDGENAGRGCRDI